MKVAIEGCLHGELEKVYDTVKDIENREGYKIDLLLCCGDFQATRNLSDLCCMAVPDKYKEMGTFWKYYAGILEAPVLTLVIGGNHEASNYLQELPYGGWLAKNIYYLGYAGVVNVCGHLTIAGLSGIFKGMDYLKGRHERPPYNSSSMRSVYHVRNLDSFRLKQLSRGRLHVVLSHDWPRGIHNYGDVEALLRRKQFFRQDIERNELGSPPAMEVLEALRPKFWFSAHLHVKFAALVAAPDDNDDDDDNSTSTKFLALDKCLPNRRFLQILDLGPPINGKAKIAYDLEWLAVLKSTNHLLAVDQQDHHMPGPGYSGGRWDFKPTEDELKAVNELFVDGLEIPDNFVQTATVFDPTTDSLRQLRDTRQPRPLVNPQTEAFCAKLDIDDPLSIIGNKSASSESSLLTMSNYANTSGVSLNQDEINLDDDEDEDEDNEDEAKEQHKRRTIMHLEEYRVEGLPWSLYYIPEFVTEYEEQRLLDKVDNSPKTKWTVLRNRRLQNWGGTPHQKGMIAEELPDWLKKVVDKVDQQEGIFGKVSPNHVLVNEYLPGQGISPHLDGDLFYPTVSTISLGSHTVLNFYHPLTHEQSMGEKMCPTLEERKCHQVLLEPRSLVVLQDRMFDHFLHGIDEVASDNVTKQVLVPGKTPIEDTQLSRSTRVSLTIRHVPNTKKLKIRL